MSSATGAAAVPRREVAAIGLVGAAHFASHFYFLALPPLFPYIKPALGVSYAELGVVLTASAAAIALMQMPFGFLADRIGARKVLIFGLALCGLAPILAASAGSYWGLLASWFLAGVGNAVFHPADYAILSASVDERRIGRAFSIHGFGGASGLAVAPFVMLLLAESVGWRGALFAVGAAGLALAVVILAFAGSMRDRDPDQLARHKGGDGAGPDGWRLLMSREMLLLFLFFVATAAAGSGINSFAVVAFVQMFGVETGTAAQALTVYLIMASGGMLAGGLLADRARRQDLIVMISFGAAALAYMVIGSAAVPFWLVFALFAVAGFLRGAVNPSRDVIVRRAAPPGSVGKVFGFVTTGFTISAAAMPPVFGWLMDTGQASWVFFTVGFFSLLGIAIVGLSRIGRG